MEYLNSIDDPITSVDENNIEYIDLFQHPELVYGTLNLSGEGLDFCKYPQEVQKEMERYAPSFCAISAITSTGHCRWTN